MVYQGICFRHSLELPLTAKGALTQELRHTWERLNSSKAPGFAKLRVELKKMVIGDVHKTEDLDLNDGVAAAKSRQYFSSFSRTDQCEGIDLSSAEIKYGGGDMIRGQINMQKAIARGDLRHASDGLYYTTKKIRTSTTGERDLLGFTGVHLISN